MRVWYSVFMVLIKQKGFADLSDYKNCLKCGLPNRMYMCLDCGIAGERKEKCEDCGEMKKYFSPPEHYLAKQRPYDWHGYSHAISDAIAAITTLRNK